jgi:hypothetical protein
MESLKPQLPKISNEERPPLVDVWLELLAWQEKQIDALKQEILKQKGETTKPTVKPSILRLMPRSTSNPTRFQRAQPLKGYREVVIQNIVFVTFNTCYRLAQYQTPEDSYV